MMTQKASLLARRLRAGTFNARITKRDGSERQIRFRLDNAPAITFSGPDNSPRVRVYDLDKREYRTLRLDAVTQLVEAAPADPSPRWSSYEEAKAEIDQLF